MNRWNVYCDESRQSGDSKYMLLGGIWVRTIFEKDIQEYWEKTILGVFDNPPRFLKWTRCPSRPSAFVYKAYTGLCDLFFRYAERDAIRFRTVVIRHDEYDMNHPVFHDGDYETAFHKLYYQLLFHPCECDNTYRIFLASRGAQGCSEGFHLALLHQVLKSAKRKCNFPVLKSMDARKSLFIQMADIFAGAVGYQYENLHLAENARLGKQQLADYLAKRLGWSNLIRRSYPSEKTFNIFRHKPGR